MTGGQRAEGLREGTGTDVVVVERLVVTLACKLKKQVGECTRCEHGRQHKVWVNELPDSPHWCLYRPHCSGSWHFRQW